VRDLVTDTVRPLTRDAGGLPDLNPQPYSPVFSPDGRQVAYLRIGQPISIRVADRDGSNARVLLDGAGDLVYDWSADGRTIALNLYNAGQSRLALLSVADGTLTQLTSTGWRKADSARFSPDGRFLVYSVPATPREPEAEAGVFVVATDGGRLTRIADGAYPAWTPDGRGLVYLSDRAGSGGLWIVPLDGGRPSGVPRRLLSGTTGARNLRFTAAGDLYYEVRTRGADVLVATFDSARGRLDEPTRLTADADTDAVLGGASWSRDGRQVAFVRDGALIVRSVTTGEERTVETTINNIQSVLNFGLRWFADERSVLLRDGASGRPALTRIDVQSGAQQVIVDGPLGASLRQFDLSPDGRVLYYVHREPVGDDGSAVFHLRSRQIETGAEVELSAVSETRAMAAVRALAVSPDGLRLALRDLSADRLVVIPTGGGPAKELLSGPATILPLAWTRDGRFIIGTRSSDAGDRLWAVAAAGGDPIDLNLSATGIRRVSVSPTDGRLLISAVRPGHEIRLVRNVPLP
jgi:Tol biopolymer transport system component